MSLSNKVKDLLLSCLGSPEARNELVDAIENPPSGSGDIKADGSIPMTGSLDLGGNLIINLADPLSAQQAATKNYVDNAIPAAGANTSLSNLGTVALNADLKPASNGATDLGSSLLSFGRLYLSNSGQITGNTIKSFNMSDSAGNRVFGLISSYTSPFALPSGATAAAGLYTGVGGDNSFDIGFYTSDNSSASVNATGSLRIETGNKTSGTGNSGSIYLQTGTSAGGVQGNINLDAPLINLIQGNISSPSAPLVLLGGNDGISQDIFIEGNNVQTDAATNIIFNAGGNINLIPITYVAVSSDLLINQIGKGLSIAAGANAKIGSATLVGGTITVANTSITATSHIFVTSQVDGGTPGFLRVSNKVVGTSFDIVSSSGTDTSTVSYVIIEQN